MLAGLILLACALLAYPVPGRAAAQGDGGAGTQRLPQGLRKAVETLRDDLALDDQQKADVKAVLDERQPALDDLLNEVEAKRAAMRAEIQQREPDEEAVAAAFAALADAEAELARARADLYLALSEVTSPGQFVTVSRFVAEMDRQVGAHEQSATYPAARVLRVLPSDRELRKKARKVVRDHQPTVRGLLIEAASARAALLVAMQQRQRDEALLGEAIKRNRARRDLAVECARIFKELAAQGLTDAQLAALGEKTAKHDAAIVMRLRVASLLPLRRLLE